MTRYRHERQGQGRDAGTTTCGSQGKNLPFAIDDHHFRRVLRKFVAFIVTVSSANRRKFVQSPPWLEVMLPIRVPGHDVHCRPVCLKQRHHLLHEPLSLTIEPLLHVRETVGMVPGDGSVVVVRQEVSDPFLFCFRVSPPAATRTEVATQHHCLAILLRGAT